MQKVDRDKIWKLFDKKCAYCGCELQTSTGKHMQIDHVKPIIRMDNACLFPNDDNLENLYPSCPQCNNYKHSMSVDMFREQIKLSLLRLRKVASYRNAIRFGLVIESTWDGKFWFEKFQK